MSGPYSLSIASMGFLISNADNIATTLSIKETSAKCAPVSMGYQATTRASRKCEFTRTDSSSKAKDKFPRVHLRFVAQEAVRVERHRVWIETIVMHYSPIFILAIGCSILGGGNVPDVRNDG